MPEASAKSNVVNEETQVDLFRDTPVRLMGYANECGESFRALIHVNWVRLSYAVASGYVVADTVDKCYKQSKLPFENESTKRRKVLKTLVDTMVWQSLASVIIPGFTINRICVVSLIILTRHSHLQRQRAKWATVFIGLGSIPFIVKPIDNLVDYFMDSFFRKYIMP
ncbi:mitochondrial fission process protein 1 [Tetranychus urticae]|nr:mitochondrial fission process protein 1 [Tetranychus urticae]XP_015782755.1 mitochondrial fission process protein 1 [Tetranychus urticae]XP_015782756.1 mitochondrial fission process protein 1 [Tetranychus urticae]XP_015782757.1 mitochondrial fission process protein 1 [Tetranychus urticae]